MLIIIWYVLLLLLLFFGVKFCKKKMWNEDNMSFDTTKCFLGFCAVVIVFHHISHMTCASWVNPKYVRHGLDIFVTAGYPMVAMFFLCSGFGLYKSAKAKPDFFKRFIPVRFIPILIPTCLTMLVYIYFMYLKKIPYKIDSPFAINNHDTWHPYIWYVPCMLLLYLLFYIGFGLIKKDWAGILVVAAGTALYIVFCIVFHYGTWWFNTPHMFLLGIILAKNEEKIFAWCKKLYALKLAIVLILFPILWFLGNNAGGLYLMISKHQYNGVYGYRSELIACIFQVLYTLVFASMYYLLSMKIKVGNKVLAFFGKFTLELYLVHGIFLHMFGYYMLVQGKKPFFYIENVSLYTLVVFALSIPVSFGISLLDKQVGKLLRPKKIKNN
ncbi:Peptidoglycan/LPS O-acetylase OafA/YrhL, contains acyltransferase and SGNH-hydrolase domains [Lachnospiraceae bacterium G41]|nr:Peptidoglycan/LPS O-acetylase OafA/YrhL, contains acyltransferase and SGNH-hydrolase domains [Lachnospiraceae bacterium G41]